MAFNPYGLSASDVINLAQSAAQGGQQYSGLNLGAPTATGAGGGSIVSSEGVSAVTELLSVLFGADNAQKILDQNASQYETDLKFRYYQQDQDSKRYLAVAQISAGAEKAAAEAAAEASRHNADEAAAAAIQVAQMDNETKRAIAAAQLEQEFNRISAEEFGSPSAWIKQMRFMLGQGQPGERAGLTLKKPTLAAPTTYQAGATSTAGAALPVASQAIAGEGGKPELLTALPGNQGTLVTPLANAAAAKANLPQWARYMPKMQGGGVVGGGGFNEWARKQQTLLGGPALTIWGANRELARRGQPSLGEQWATQWPKNTGYRGTGGYNPAIGGYDTGGGLPRNRSPQLNKGGPQGVNPISARMTAARRLMGQIEGGGATVTALMGRHGETQQMQRTPEQLLAQYGGTLAEYQSNASPDEKWKYLQWIMAGRPGAVASMQAGGVVAPTSTAKPWLTWNPGGTATAATSQQQQVANLPLWALGQGGKRQGLWQNWTGPRTIPEVGLNEPLPVPHEFDYRQWVNMTPAQQQMWLAAWEALGYYPEDALAILEASAPRGTATGMTAWG